MSMELTVGWASRLVVTGVAFLLGAVLLSPSEQPAHDQLRASPSGGATGLAEPRLAAAVSALGRLEPEGGIRRVAGPSRPFAVVARLLVEKGDPVAVGQVLAILDDEPLREAEVAQASARLRQLQVQRRRQLALHERQIVADAAHDQLQTELEIARAELAAAQAERERSRVRSPIDGRVIDVHAREGERVGPEGLLELGRTDQMYAIAEVYETDVRSIQLGQRATVYSPALPDPLHGVVDRIGVKVAKLDALGTDPVSRTDARIVEVDVRLERSVAAAAYSLLQVEVVFEP